MSLQECRRCSAVLLEIRKDLDEHHGVDLVCNCHENAKSALPDLLVKLASGDEFAVEPILSFYQPCIDLWAKDIYDDPVYESQFKAELAVRFIQTARKLESQSLCRELKLASLDIVDAQLKHIEEHQCLAGSATPVLVEA
jgi:hypothetical protein